MFRTVTAAVVLGAVLGLAGTATAAAADTGPSGSGAADATATPAASDVAASRSAAAAPSGSPSGSVSQSPSGSPSTSPPGGSLASPSPVPSGGVTVTVAANCDAYSIDATITNRTGAPVTIGVANASGPVFQTLTVAAGATGVLRIKAEFSNSYNLQYSRLDTAVVLAVYQNELFACPKRYDRSVQVVSGTTYRSDPICPAFGGTRPAHGTLRVLDDWSFTYT